MLTINHQRKSGELGELAWAYHPSTLVAEAGLYVPGQHGLLGKTLSQNRQNPVWWCMVIIRGRKESKGEFFFRQNKKHKKPNFDF